ETIGGKGDFAASWQAAWAATGRAEAEVWRGAQPGHALRRAGYGNRWWTANEGKQTDPIDAALFGATWRSSTSLAEAAEQRPALLSVGYGDRVGIVVSHTDLTLGGMGVRSDEVVGLTPDSATRVLAALIHEAAGRSTGVMTPADTPGAHGELELADGISAEAHDTAAARDEGTAAAEDPPVAPRRRTIAEVDTSNGVMFGNPPSTR
ncbi:MAG: hypothetical protein AAF078_12095, partial [Planctomycetota bacterium]